MSALTEPDLNARRAYLGRQRWFVSTDGAITGTEALEWSRPPHDGFGVRVELIGVETAVGRRTYHVPAAYRREPFAGMESALMAVEDGWYVYDALHDAHARTELLRGFAEQPDTSTPADLDFTSDGIAVHEPWTRPLATEQSNTSIVVENRWLWKCLRIVSPGVNPEIELGQVLNTHGDSVVPRLRGWIARHSPRTDLGFLHDFVTGASDGWELARASVRDLLSGPPVVDPEAAGADFAAEAARLGRAVATLHRHLAPVDAEVESTERIAERLRHRFDATSSAKVLGPAAHRAFDALARLDAPVPVHRVHGDLHLGQVLRSVAGWQIFDLEGEPAASLVERRRPDSPLRDVAGMLRSLDYAPHSVLLQAGGDPRPVQQWIQRNSEAFLVGYGSYSDPLSWTLLRCFQIDKAAYEVDYESSHRPAWATIPRAALDRLLRPESESAQP